MAFAHGVVRKDRWVKEQQTRVSVADRSRRPGQRLHFRSPAFGLCDACSPDRHDGPQPRQLGLQHPTAERRRLPVFAPFVGVGLGARRPCGSGRLTEPSKGPIEGGDFESRSGRPGARRPPEDRVAVTRLIHDAQQDVELDASKREVLIGSGIDVARDEWTKQVASHYQATYATSIVAQAGADLFLNVIAGSTLAARREGCQTARRQASATTRICGDIGGGSNGSRRQANPRGRFPPLQRSRRPASRPQPATTAVCFSTSMTTSRGCAPSAIRTPISRRLRATRNEITAYNPTRLSASPTDRATSSWSPECALDTARSPDAHRTSSSQRRHTRVEAGECGADRRRDRRGCAAATTNVNSPDGTWSQAKNMYGSGDSVTERYLPVSTMPVIWKLPAFVMRSGWPTALPAGQYLRAIASLITTSFGSDAPRRAGNPSPAGGVCPSPGSSSARRP